MIPRVGVEAARRRISRRVRIAACVTTSGARLQARTTAHISRLGGTKCRTAASAGRLAGSARRAVQNKSEAPDPRASDDLVSGQPEFRVPHVEHVPQLREGQGQKGDGDRLRLVEVEPDAGVKKRPEGARGRRQALQDDGRPLRAPEDRLLRGARLEQPQAAATRSPASASTISPGTRAWPKSPRSGHPAAPELSYRRASAAPRSSARSGFRWRSRRQC